MLKSSVFELVMVANQENTCLGHSSYFHEVEGGETPIQFINILATEFSLCIYGMMFENDLLQRSGVVVYYQC